MICYYQLNLYTGKVGYVFTDKNIRWNIIPIYFGNFIGAGAVSLPIRYIKPELVDTAKALAAHKLEMGIFSIIISSIACGILMYLAVDNYKNNSNMMAKNLGIIMCVAVFILSGFEHSIADMNYFFLGLNNYTQIGWTIGFLGLVSIGNALGAWCARLVTK